MCVCARTRAPRSNVVGCFLCLQLEENEKQMNEMKQNWEQKLKDAHDALQVSFKFY